VRRGVGGGEGDEGEGGRVGGDCVREASFSSNLAQVGLCGS
jgi:hypothetical protein